MLTLYQKGQIQRELEVGGGGTAAHGAISTSISPPIGARDECTLFLLTPT